MDPKNIRYYGPDSQEAKDFFAEFEKAEEVTEISIDDLESDEDPFLN